MTTKHTPGPWVTNGRAIETDASPAMYLASVSDERDVPIDASEAKANARLIAAAPELLEALEQLHGLIAEQRWGAKWDEHPDMVLARKAIAAATGEAK